MKEHRSKLSKFMLLTTDINLVEIYSFNKKMLVVTVKFYLNLEDVAQVRCILHIILHTTGAGVWVGKS